MKSTMNPMKRKVGLGSSKWIVADFVKVGLGSSTWLVGDVVKKNHLPILPK